MIKRLLLALGLVLGLLGAGPAVAGAGTWTDYGWHAAGAGSIHCVGHQDTAGHQFWCDAYPHSGGIVFSVVHVWLPTWCAVGPITTYGFGSVKIKPAASNSQNCAAWQIPSTNKAFRKVPYGEYGGYASIAQTAQVFPVVVWYTHSPTQYGTEFQVAINY